MVVEVPTVFECQGEQLIGIIHRPPVPREVGILIVVGGPQYRAGSHRQFLLLARHLAENGFPVMRFDYRGMGDSGGALRTFEDISDDVRASINHFLESVPEIKRIVIWGLCDASSAALFYAHTDPRVTGLVLLNPWVRTAQGEAEAYVKQYYLSRLINRAFWLKLVQGRVSISSSLRSLADNIWKMVFAAKKASNNDDKSRVKASLPDRMHYGFQRFNGEILIILSGKDLTADEFRNLVSKSKEWKQQIRKESVRMLELPEANHTFSSHVLRDQVNKWTCDWLLKRIVESPVPD